MGMDNLVSLCKTQRSLARHQSYYPGDTAFNLTFLTRVTGPVDVERLHGALLSISRAHRTFRTDFVEQGGAFSKRVVSEREPQVPLLTRAPHIPQEEFVRGVQAYARSLQNATPRKEWPLHDISLHVASPEEAYIVTCVPHLIADGYGYSAWLRGVSECYNGRTPSREAAAPTENPAAASSRERRANAHFAEELQHLTSLEMPSFVQPRGEDGGISGRIVAFHIERVGVDGEIAEGKMSPGQFFLAVYACLLRRLAPADRIILGYAVPGRAAGHWGEVDCFINTVPAVLDIAPSMSFAVVVEAIGSKLFRLHRYQDYDADAFPSVAQRMSALFTFYSEEFNYSLDGCTCTSIPVERKHLPAEIRLTVEARQSTYRVVFDLGTYFDAMNIKAEFEAVLQTARSAPDTPIMQMPLSRSVVHGRPLHMSEGQSVGKVFTDTATRFSQNIAVQSGSRSLTYRELDHLSNQIAASLVLHPAAYQHIVLAMERSVESVATVLAIVKLGKTYVPLDPKLPQARVEQVLRDLESPFIVSPQPLASGVPGISCEQLMQSAESCEGKSALAFPVDPDCIAYMIYTSGSTGTPKGVPVSHRNLLSLIASCTQQFGFCSKDVWTLFHSFSFDYSIWEMFGSLLNGGRLVIPDQESIQDPARFYALLAHEGVTVMNHTPGMFRNLIREDSKQTVRIQPRSVFLGGEALHFSVLADWFAAHPLSECSVVNLYGPTEATVLATAYKVGEADLTRRESLIGFPIAGSSITVRGADGMPVGCGVPGEIVIRGAGVAAGYYRKQGAAEGKFFADSGCAAFRTGDLGRMCADGALEYLGRMDRQVKVRGFRLELADIEAALRKQDLADSAVDLLPGEGSGEAKLVAYVVPGARPFVEPELRAALKQLLPSYMVPVMFVQMDAIPFTISGKVDFERLKQQVGNESGGTKGNTQSEIWLADLVGEKLRHTNFGLTDNLLDIGFSSLEIVGLVSDISARYPGTKLRVLDVFEYPTIQALASFLDQSLRPMQDAAASGRANLRQTMLAAQRMAGRAV